MNNGSDRPGPGEEEMRAYPGHVDHHLSKESDMQTLERKLDFVGAFRALAAARRNPDDTESGVKLVSSLEGRSLERFFQRFIADPAGAAIVRERRSLFALLDDREALAKLPPGSLGRAYIEWTEVEEITAAGLAIAAESWFAEYEISEDRRLVMERYRDTHDLWHVLTGYGRDLVGELALLTFTLVQIRHAGLALPVVFGYLSHVFDRPRRKLLNDAWGRARQSAWLPVQDWEGLVERPLDQVRKELRVGPPPVYEPIRSSYAPPVKAHC
jgi:ubiquinone biosynthesis protein COQ4